DQSGPARAPLRTVRHNQADGPGPRTVDFPNNHRGARRKAVGRKQSRWRRDLPLLRARSGLSRIGASAGRGTTGRGIEGILKPGGISIAIVEDDDSIRVSLSRLCNVWGFTARAYASGAEFIASVDVGTPPVDCLIMDAHMPAMTGAELIDLLTV